MYLLVRKIGRINTPAFLFLTAIAIILCLSIGPWDSFTHGFFSTHADVSDILEKDKRGTLPVGTDEVFLGAFIPQEAHYSGFELYLSNVSEVSDGTLLLTVRNSSGEELSVGSVDLSLPTLTSWCHVTIAPELRDIEETYQLYVSAEECSVAPELLEVDPDYLGGELSDCDVLIGLAYRQSSFSLADKVFLISCVMCIWLLTCMPVVYSRGKVWARKAAAFIFMCALLSWNYSTSVLDNANAGSSFTGFQQDSESLVTSVMESAIEGRVQKNSPYGLGRITDVLGRRVSCTRPDLLSDDDWDYGFSRTEAALLISNNEYSRSVAVVGNHILFHNGDRFRIVGVEQIDNGLRIDLGGGATRLSRFKHGPFYDAVFLDSDGNQLPRGVWSDYGSQFGLQGKVFWRFGVLVDDYDFAVESMHLICSVLLAVTVMGIVVLVRRKYNYLMSACFYLTFLLSPWVVNFANNLYWVEFSWFLPVLVGLVCSMHVDHMRARCICYLLECLLICAKCLCGYEYISTIMVASVAFIGSDAAAAFVQGDSIRLQKLMRAFLGVGAAMLLGFILAILIHANIRGGGNLAAGIIDIFERDVLRRTNGGSLDAFDPGLWPSLRASRWEVLLKYFSFPTEVIVGLRGNLFPLLQLAAIAGLEYRSKAGQPDIRVPALHFLFFCAAVSWFVLAKSHSFVHTHMNYVLWSFGSIQMCCYVIVDAIWSLLTSGCREPSGNHLKG